MKRIYALIWIFTLIILLLIIGIFAGFNHGLMFAIGYNTAMLFCIIFEAIEESLK